MKTQKGLAILATLSVLALSVACSDRYDEGYTAGKEQGYTEGYDVGYDDGYADGDEAGYARAKDLFMSADYKKGFEDGQTQSYQIGYNNGVAAGRTAGQTEGYNQGYAQGKTDGKAEGYTSGYDVGYDDGYADGYDTINLNAYNDGRNAGYSAGYDIGYDDGDADGYDRGYDDGFKDGDTRGYNVGYSAGETAGYNDGHADGYDIGYDDGYADGYGLKLGKTQPQRGFANILSMAHNDLIDYSKIKLPAPTKRGLVANGRLLLSENSLTNKDTFKKKAVVEQYVVLEMGKQISAKLSLNPARSLQIAKAANHFRKATTNRAFTNEDTQAYFLEISGSDQKTLDKAIDSAKTGDLSLLDSVFETAAKKNSTTPENMKEILTKNFI